MKVNYFRDQEWEDFELMDFSYRGVVWYEYEERLEQFSKLVDKVYEVMDYENDQSLRFITKYYLEALLEMVIDLENRICKVETGEVAVELGNQDKLFPYYNRLAESYCRMSDLTDFFSVVRAETNLNNLEHYENALAELISYWENYKVPGESNAETYHKFIAQYDE